MATYVEPPRLALKRLNTEVKAIKATVFDGFNKSNDDFYKSLPVRLQIKHNPAFKSATKAEVEVRAGVLSDSRAKVLSKKARAAILYGDEYEKWLYENQHIRPQAL